MQMIRRKNVRLCRLRDIPTTHTEHSPETVQLISISQAPVVPEIEVSSFPDIELAA